MGCEYCFLSAAFPDLQDPPWRYDTKNPSKLRDNCLNTIHLTMDLIQQAAEAPALAPVLTWRIEEADADTGSVTSRLTRECVSVFRRFMRILPKSDVIPPKAFRQIERSCSSLILWDKGYDISSGDIDNVLAKSRKLRRSILERLISISEILSDSWSPNVNIYAAYKVLISPRTAATSRPKR